MHGLTGGDWKRGRDQRKPRQSPTLPNYGLTWPDGWVSCRRFL